ncbi:unnamed protein product, partial [Dicrocoelium dendriticum]
STQQQYYVLAFRRERGSEVTVISSKWLQNDGHTAIIPELQHGGYDNAVQNHRTPAPGDRMHPVRVIMQTGGNMPGYFPTVMGKSLVRNLEINPTCRRHLSSCTIRRNVFLGIGISLRGPWTGVR